MKSPIDSVIIDLILTHFNIKAFQGKPSLLTSEDFDRIVHEAKEYYYKKVLKQEQRGES